MRYSKLTDKELSDWIIANTSDRALSLEIARRLEAKNRRIHRLETAGRAGIEPHWSDAHLRGSK